MKLAFICTNYNNSQVTSEAVRSLGIAKDRAELRIIIVDNASADTHVETLRTIESNNQHVEVIYSERNLGYFNGLNLGIQRLLSTDPKFDLVVVGNNDLIFPPDFADSLERNVGLFKKHPVISPDIVTLDGEHQNPHVLHGISAFRTLVYDAYYTSHTIAQIIRKLAAITRRATDRADETHYETAQEIEQGYGACYLLTPMFFLHFSELSAPTFMYHEELFLTEQLREQGMRVYYDPSIQVFHNCHATTGSVPSRKAWELGRDAHRIVRQNRSKKKLGGPKSLTSDLRDRSSRDGFSGI
jgi:GT2 family glycosyltransferase